MALKESWNTFNSQNQQDSLEPVPAGFLTSYNSVLVLRED